MASLLKKPPMGFTLIELLTVIAVIAILLGIVLVSLQKVRRSAELVDGVSALRNVGSAMSLLVMDNGGRLPWSAQDNQYAHARNPGNDQLLHQLIPYFGVEGLQPNEIIPGSVGKAYLRDRDPLAYPAYRTNTSVMFDDGIAGRAFGRSGSGSGEDTPAKPALNVADPNRQVALTDVDMLLRQESGALAAPTRDAPVYSKRLVLYFDWRAEAVSFEYNYYYRKLW
jgi:prepilin-type N-terminal cleavage/methylation domain-containing protein